MVLKSLFLVIFVVGFSSIFHYASSHANPSVDDAKPSASDPKKKSYFPYFKGFWWHLQRVEVWWFYGYKGSMMGSWFWFASSFIWLEWTIVHGKSYFYICEFFFFFLEKSFVKSWCSILLLEGVNHSRIVASLLASISLYCRRGKPPKHLKVKSQAVSINY